MFKRTVTRRHRPSAFWMRLVVIVPAGPPIVVVWINDITSPGAFHMALGKKDVRVEVMPVGRDLRMPA